MSHFARAVLFANGEAGCLGSIEISQQDYLVAVDGGLHHLTNLNLTPHLLIGDLDSVDPGALPALQTIGVEILRFPPAKNQTDLELALYHVIAQGFRHILIVAALGGRLDQTLGNLALLTSPDLEAVDVRMDDGKERIFLIRKDVKFTCCVGDRISLIPSCAHASGVTTTGLAYPLHHETLFPHQTRGISNEAIAEEISIQIQTGMLLCLHTRCDQKSQEKEVNHD
jgi:thiamine pyrophosphokinase